MIDITIFRRLTVFGRVRRPVPPETLKVRRRVGLPDHLLRDIGLLDGTPRRRAH